MWTFIFIGVSFALGAVFAVNCKKMFDKYIENVAVPTFLASRTMAASKKSDEEKSQRLMEQLDNLLQYTGEVK